MTSAGTGRAEDAAAPVQRAEFREALLRLEQIEKMLHRVQGLTQRVYERGLDEPALLAAARRAASYEAAYLPEPLVSVRIATYQGADVLAERAIPSLLAQTYERWECLIVGDATPDDTAECVASFRDSRLRFHNLSVRGPYPDDPEERWFCAGTAPANEGIRGARGQWIAALDHDDEWDPDHLECLLTSARESRAEVVYGRIRVVGAEDGRPAGGMGAWPPVRGEFGFLAALVHEGLRFFEYDTAARLGSEPGDWNLARRMWDAGVSFEFVDRELATHFFTPKHGARTALEQTVDELRQWVEELDDLRRRQLDELGAERDAAVARIEQQRVAFDKRLDLLLASVPARRRMRRSPRDEGTP